MGTMVVKSTIFNVEGDILGLGRGEYPIESPHPGWAEHDQELWWSETKRTIREALSQAKIPSNEIVSIGCCAQSHGPTLIDKDGNVLRKCIIWPDRRAVKQSRWIKENVGERQSNQTVTAPKLLWIMENEPQIWKKTYKILLPKDFLVYRLTGELSSEPLDAQATGMFDQEKKDWSDDFLKSYKIPRDKLVELKQPWDIVGSVTEKAAEETGLAKGTPVVAGAADGPCQVYGAGLVKVGRGLDRTGTVGQLFVAVDRAVAPNASLFILPDVVRMGTGGTQTAGASYRWFRDRFCSIEKILAEALRVDEYELMDAQVKMTNPGAGGVIFNPYLLGRGGPMNKHGWFFGITLHTSREQMMRAILEGFGFEMRRGKERNWKRLGVDCKEVWTTGGGNKSKIWRQIKADILNVAYCTTNIEETGNLGAAVIAGYGVGIYKDLVSPIESIVKVVERTEPRDQYLKIYDELYSIYDKLNTLLEESGIYEDYVKALEQTKLLG
jgi:xylulokinase